MFSDHVVNQEFRRQGQHQSADPADQEQEKTERQQAAARAHQLPDHGPNGFELLPGGFLLPWP